MKDDVTYVIPKTREVPGTVREDGTVVGGIRVYDSGLPEGQRFRHQQRKRSNGLLGFDPFKV